MSCGLLGLRGGPTRKMGCSLGLEGRETALGQAEVWEPSRAGWLSVPGPQGPGLSHVLHPHLAWQCGAEQAAGARDKGYKWRSCDLRNLVPWGKGPGWQGEGKGLRRCWPSAGGLQFRGPGEKRVMVCRLEALGGEQGRAGSVEEVEEMGTLDSQEE